MRKSTWDWREVFVYQREPAKGTWELLTETRGAVFSVGDTLTRDAAQRVQASAAIQLCYTELCRCRPLFGHPR